MIEYNTQKHGFLMVVIFGDNDNDDSDKLAVLLTMKSRMGTSLDVGRRLMMSYVIIGYEDVTGRDGRHSSNSLSPKNLVKWFQIILSESSISSSTCPSMSHSCNVQSSIYKTAGHL